MSIRKVKKLLQKYPPIVEIHVPEYPTQEMHSELSERFESFNKEHNTNFLFFFFPLPKDFPTYKVEFDTNMDEDKLEKFKKEWLETMKNPSNVPKISSSSSNVTNIEIIPHIHIHSVVKLGLNEYKKKLQNLLKDVDTEKTKLT